MKCLVSVGLSVSVPYTRIWWLIKRNGLLISRYWEGLQAVVFNDNKPIAIIEYDKPPSSPPMPHHESASPQYSSITTTYT